MTAAEVGADITIERGREPADPRVLATKLKIEPFSRKGSEWMKKTKTSYRGMGNWDPMYSREEAARIAESAVADGLTVGVADNVHHIAFNPYSVDGL